MNAAVNNLNYNREKASWGEHLDHQKYNAAVIKVSIQLSIFQLRLTGHSTTQLRPSARGLKTKPLGGSELSFPL